MKYRNELLFVISIDQNFIIMTHTHTYTYTYTHTHMRVLSPLTTGQLDVTSVFISLTIPYLFIVFT